MLLETVKVVNIEAKYQLIPLVYLPVNHLFQEQITLNTTHSKGKNKANTLGKASIEESLGMPAGEHILKIPFHKAITNGLHINNCYQWTTEMAIICHILETAYKPSSGMKCGRMQHPITKGTTKTVCDILSNTQIFF